LVDRANGLLAKRSAEVEDLHLRCSDLATEETVAREQAASLAKKARKLEEDLARVAIEQDAFKIETEREVTTAKTLGEQLGMLRTELQLQEGALAQATKADEASQNEALQSKQKAEGNYCLSCLFSLNALFPVFISLSLGLAQGWRKLASAAATLAALQMAFNAKTEEHAALQRAIRVVCDALEARGGQSGSSLQGRLMALYDRMHERLREALYTRVKHALAVVCTPYFGINLEAVSKGYVDTEENVDSPDDELLKLVEVTEAPSATLAALFGEEVVPPPADL
jgi:hypothetical protein